VRRSSFRRARPVLLVGVLATAAVAGGCGEDDGAGPPAVADGWAVPIDDQAAAVYMTITAAEADELTGARVERAVASRTEIVNPADDTEAGPGHLGHLDPGGSLGPDHGHSLALPAERPVALEPDGAYLAVGPLARPLAPGDRFSVTLTFGESDHVSVDVTVRPDPA
jgi:copper(I)-binding protein